AVAPEGHEAAPAPDQLFPTDDSAITETEAISVVTEMPPTQTATPTAETEAPTEGQEPLVGEPATHDKDTTKSRSRRRGRRKSDSGRRRGRGGARHRRREETAKLPSETVEEPLASAEPVQSEQAIPKTTPEETAEQREDAPPVERERPTFMDSAERRTDED